MATSHKRETARRTPRAAVLAGSLAVLATGAAVSAGVLGSSPQPDHDLLAVDGSRVANSVHDASRDLPVISRGSDRSADLIGTKVDRMLAKAAVAKAVRGAQARWTTDALNLWTRPDKAARKVGEVASGEKVLATGRHYADRVEIVVQGKVRWVTAGHLSEDKPATLGGSCTNGTTVPGSVSANIKKVHAAVCANFPDISTYGTFRGDGEHAQGIAVDIMISGDAGWKVAEFVRANAAALGVSYVIYSQHIWSVERSGEGWRSMPDRGSTTANHYDHVHVTTY